MRAFFVSSETYLTLPVFLAGRYKERMPFRSEFLYGTPRAQGSRMVYEQDGQRWIFFHDLFGRWQWTRIDATGITLEQAVESFRTFCLCIRDARTRGFSMRRARSMRAHDATQGGQH